MVLVGAERAREESERVSKRREMIRGRILKGFIIQKEGGGYIGVGFSRWLELDVEIIQGEIRLWKEFQSGREG